MTFDTSSAALAGFFTQLTTGLSLSAGPLSIYHSTTMSTNTKSNALPKKKEDTNRPPLWRVWLMAARPHTLTASIVPVLTGHFCSTAFVSQPHYQSISVTPRALLFSILIQLATNLHNDYADFVKGADTETRVGQARATQRGWLTPEQTAGASTFCAIAALAVGITFTFDLLTWFVILSSVFNAFAYTGGPYPLGLIGLGNVSIAYSGLGDIFCFLYFGVVASFTVPYVTVRMNEDPNNTSSMIDLAKGPQLWPCFIAGLPVGFLATAILVVNNLRDRHTDAVAGKRTLAVRLGGTFCRCEYFALLFSSYAVLLVLYQEYSESGLLLPLYTLPLAIVQIKSVWTKEGSDLNPHVGKTALLQLTFCILLMRGLSQLSRD